MITLAEWVVVVLGVALLVGAFAREVGYVREQRKRQREDIRRLRELTGGSGGR